MCEAAVSSNATELNFSVSVSSNVNMMSYVLPLNYIKAVLSCQLNYEDNNVEQKQKKTTIKCYCAYITL